MTVDEKSHGFMPPFHILEKFLNECKLATVMNMPAYNVTAFSDIPLTLSLIASPALLGFFDDDRPFLTIPTYLRFCYHHAIPR